MQLCCTGKWLFCLHGELERCTCNRSNKYWVNNYSTNANFKGPWTPKLTYTFYLFSWKCRIFW